MVSAGVSTKNNIENLKMALNRAVHNPDELVKLDLLLRSTSINYSTERK